MIKTLFHRMNLIKTLCVIMFMITSVISNNCIGKGFEWRNISKLPESVDHGVGRAGTFSGFIGDYLVVVGGANFPAGMPWEGGKKQYHNDIFIGKVDRNGLHWNSKKEHYLNSIAYGGTVSTEEGLMFIGGENGHRISSDVTLLDLELSTLDVSYKKLPSLPLPLSNLSCVILNDKVYVAGGVTDKGTKVSTNLFFQLDVSDLNRRHVQWEQLPSFPGPSRAYSTMVVQSDGEKKAIYLIGGRSIEKGKKIEVLDSGLKYDPILSKWSKLSGSFPIMAGNAFGSGQSFIVFPTGTDGRLLVEEMRLKGAQQSDTNDTDINEALVSYYENHPGFPNHVYVYNTITNELVVDGKLPNGGVATASFAKHKNKFYVVSGEVRPGVRTPWIVEGQFVSHKQSLGWLNILVLIVYFSLLIWIGYYFSKRQKNTDDYFKGGGRVPWWAAGLSIFGTALSAITFMAIPAKSYATNWSYVWLNLGVIAVAPLIVYIFIPYFRKQNITTAYEYLEIRFNYFLRAAGSASFILYQIGRMGVVLFLPAIALNVVTGIDIYVCISMMGVLSLLYTLMGGIEAVIWTDAMQVVVLLGGAILSLFLIANQVDGGFTGIMKVAISDQKIEAFNTAFDWRQPTLWVVLIGGLFNQFSTYASDQTMVQRYLTTPDTRSAQKSVWTNAILTIPATFIFFFVGTALYVFYKQHPADMNYALVNGDSIFPWYITNELPNGIVGILISGIFAAAMSSVSSSINSAATSYCIDFHFRVFNSSNKSMVIAKRATLVIGLLGTSFALLMAGMEIKSLWDTFNKVLGLIIGGLGGLFLLGVLFPKVDGRSASVAFILTIILQVIISNFTNLHLLLYTATGVVICCLLGVMFHIILPKSK
ncbi:sodium/solute symporter [Halosquirtibacter xylanolyticus]|uniref:sodium:solute symporter family transporter n=1 Tax=Halosquirtibacter xylanolyticus TaxID=3374599 RepID=UPI00374A224B|nr:sodium/solute symporter [Prolixibacteraceae bacterium]